MDVIFEPQRGGGRAAFSIEVGFFDTVQEIKEKIEKYEGIPVSRQTLVFKSKVLEDECKIEESEILQNSHIQLIIDHNESSDQCKKKSSSIKMHIKSSSLMAMVLEVEPSDTIGVVKEKIHKADKTIPIDSFTLHSSSSNSNSSVSSDQQQQLQDNLTIGELAVDNSAEMELRILHNKYNSPAATSAAVIPSPPPSNYSATAMNNNAAAAAAAATSGATLPNPVMVSNNNNNIRSSSGNNNKLRIMVLIKGGPSNKIPLVVNSGDCVGDLRKEVESLKEKLNFSLPPEGYFFIYRQNVMEEDKSYRWHHVSHGDTIEIFNGSVSGGGS